MPGYACEAVITVTPAAIAGCADRVIVELNAWGNLILIKGASRYSIVVMIGRHFCPECGSLCKSPLEHDNNEARARKLDFRKMP
jgi:hypothetical protein